MKTNIQIKGRCKLQVFSAEGELLQDSGFHDNIITYVGYAAAAGLLGNTGAISAFTYLAVGTNATAVAATDTTLGTELSTDGLARAAATVSRVTTSQTNDTLQLTYTWTASNSHTVQEAGIFNAASTGTMLSHVLTGALALVSGNLLVATYQVQVS